MFRLDTVAVGHVCTTPDAYPLEHAFGQVETLTNDSALERDLARIEDERRQAREYCRINHVTLHWNVT